MKAKLKLHAEMTESQEALRLGEPHGRICYCRYLDLRIPVTIVVLLFVHVNIPSHHSPKLVLRNQIFSMRQAQHFHCHGRRHAAAANQVYQRLDANANTAQVTITHWVLLS